jgi:hypothetical protein
VLSWHSAAEGREQAALVEIQEVVLHVPGPQGEVECDVGSLKASLLQGKLE